MKRRKLGSTGVEVSMIGLGGSHIGGTDVSSTEAVRLIRTAIDRGLTFMDNSWDYHEGESERRLGRALRDGYRAKAFVMTKVDGRNRKEAAKQLDESLRRMQLESIDLLQHHEIIRFDDVDRIFEEGGAMEAFTEAQRAGKIRFIGFTGHKDPAVHLYMLDVARRHGVRLDTVQLPLNPFDAHFRSFEQHVLPILTQQEIGVLGMKSMGGGLLLKSKAVQAVECLRYALTLPTSVVITGIDSEEILLQSLDLMENFQPMSEAEMQELRDRSATDAADGAFELFKTTSIFDKTAQYPNLLGEESKRTHELAGR